jgi:hypothetical protein
MSVTGGIMAGIGVAGAVGSAAIGSNAATNAANTQASAADQAAQLQYQASQNSLAFQEQEYNQGQQNLQPWLQSGTGALSSLDYDLGINPETSAQFQGAGSPTATPSTPTSTTQLGNFGAPTSGSTVTQQPGANAMAQQVPGGVGGALSTFNPTGQPSGVIPGTSTTQGATMAPTGPVGGTGIAPPSSNPVTGGLTNGGGITQASGGPAASGGAGASATSTAAGGFGSLLSPYPEQFTAPTAAQAEQYPGEQFMLQQGTQAVDQSAAANGSLLTGGTAKALDAYGQGLASTDYQNVYNDAYNTYSSNYNQYENQQANEYNRLASLAGVGQTAASQLGTLGANAASGVTSNLLGTASAMGQDYQNAAAANASGYVGSANAYSGALSGSTGSLSNLLLLSQLQNAGSTSGPNEQPQGEYYPGSD